jgi:hypothetical protein
MTTTSLIADIQFEHIESVSVGHIVRILIAFIPQLQSLQNKLSELFRTKWAKHRLPLRKTEVQPLGTNDAKEIETQGMIDALNNFDSQMGLGPENSTEFITWVRGDGGSHASVLRGQKHCFSTPDHYSAGRHRLSTPEWWHTRKTMLDHIAENHQGSSTSSDPSALSRSYNRVGFKIPSNVKNCDFYPTVRSMTTVFEAQVLDCWRYVSILSTRLSEFSFHFSLHYQCPNTLSLYFDNLEAEDKLPTIDDLLAAGQTIYTKYFSQQAYERSLDKERYDNELSDRKAPPGKVWTQQTTSNVEILHSGDNIPSDDAPTAHTEVAGFLGDRVLANSILFKFEFVLWLEMAYAIPEGDIGRAFEILKVCNLPSLFPLVLTICNCSCGL